MLNYAGGEHWWLTVGPNVRVIGQDDDPDFRLNVIFAVSF